MIHIHWDYVDGTEVSYAEGLLLCDNFTTNCLDFFSNDIEADVIVMKKNGEFIQKSRLNKLHSAKQIRLSHNILKMLKADSFSWCKDFALLCNEEETYDINYLVLTSAKLVIDIVAIVKERFAEYDYVRFTQLFPKLYKYNKVASCCLADVRCTITTGCSCGVTEIKEIYEKYSIMKEAEDVIVTAFRKYYLLDD
jgi:hypothetical protein